MSDRQDAIVIGGGVIGLSTAYYLLKHGWQVRLLETRHIGAGSSHGNCGFICPSHILPLTLPGAPWKILRTMFKRDSPLAIKCRFDPTLWAWLVRFALQCRQKHVVHAAQARHALLSSTMTLYHELLADESLDIEWQNQGLLLVFRSLEEFTAHGRAAKLLHEDFSVVATPYAGDRLTQFEPTLKPGCAGGWHYPGDSHLRPDKLLAALAKLLASRGVELLEGVSAQQIKTSSGKAHSIGTSKGSMSAELIVLAAGAESPVLARQLGCSVPIQPGKGYSITMSRPERGVPAVPLIFEEYHVALTPWCSGVRIGSTMEFAGYDRKINDRRIALFKRAASEYLVDPCNEPIQEQWYGWRPMTFDELPCIGPLPGLPNVFIAAGHGMIGMATALATGKLVAQLASDAQPQIDPVPYSPNRFRRT
jgi:D-amino-acid dehydrogenase